MTRTSKFGLPAPFLQAPSAQSIKNPEPDYGRPLDLPPPATRTNNPLPLVDGYNARTAPPNLPAGALPSSQNFVLRDGGLEPRWGMSLIGGSGSTNASSALLNTDVGIGLGEYSTTTGARFPFAMSAGTFIYLNGSWISGSYATQPVNMPLSGGNTNYFDTAVVYHPTLDENGLVFVNSVNSAFWWDGPSRRTFSTLTNAPIASTVAPFDARLVFANIGTGTSNLPQRIIWSDRALPETYAAPGGGQADLLDASGRIQRLITQTDRILVFFDFEIWAGFKADYPFGLQFYPLDRTVGTPAPWSIVQTPKGLMFLGSDFNLYLIPPGGTPQQIGVSVWPALRDAITLPELSVGVYDPRTFEYFLYYCAAGGSGRPQACIRFHTIDGTFTPDVHVHGICRVATAQLSSSATTFGGLVGSFAAQGATSYGQYAGVTGNRVALAITSNGTVAQFASGASNDLGSAIDCRALTHLGNPNPTERLFLKDVWLDYMAISASSVTINFSPNFGQQFTASIGLALPASQPSGQTIANVAFSAVYPSIQFQHDKGHKFRLQRVTAVTEGDGRG